MIFITVGTTKYAFPRLIDTVLILAEKYPRRSFVIQSGTYICSSIIPLNVLIQSYFSFEQTRDYINISTHIIAHCGFGTIIQALTVGSGLQVLPRKKILGEHANDHQLQLAKYLGNRKLVKVAKNLYDMEIFIASKPSNVKTSFKLDQRLINQLQMFTDSI